ncbi:hypothetical protein V8C42DRAFT_309391 [Trichoderma barbatum]
MLVMLVMLMLMPMLVGGKQCLFTATPSRSASTRTSDSRTRQGRDVMAKAKTKDEAQPQLESRENASKREKELHTNLACLRRWRESSALLEDSDSASGTSTQLKGREEAG